MSALEVASQFFGSRPDQVFGVTRPGYSRCTVWRVQYANEQFALKLWPINDIDAARLTWIQQIVRKAKSSGCKFLPDYLATCRNEPFVILADGYWEMCTWMPGTPDFNENPSYSRLRNLVCALKAFHLATRKIATLEKTSPVVDRRLHLLSELRDRIDIVRSKLTAQLSDTRVSIASRTIHLIDQAKGLLENWRPEKSQSFLLQPVLRDVWHDHLFFLGDDLTAIIDFGAVTLDTTYCDWARCLGSLHWNHQSIWPIAKSILENEIGMSREEFRLIRWLAVSGTMFSILHWLTWLFVDEQPFYDQTRGLARLNFLEKQLELEIHQNL